MNEETEVQRDQIACTKSTAQARADTFHFPPLCLNTLWVGHYCAKLLCIILKKTALSEIINNVWVVFIYLEYQDSYIRELSIYHTCYVDTSE